MRKQTEKYAEKSIKYDHKNKNIFKNIEKFYCI